MEDRHKSMHRYPLAAAAVAAAFLVCLLLEKAFGQGVPVYAILYPPVMAVALLAGLGPGLLAMGLSALVAATWLLAPDGLSLLKTVDVVGLGLFSLTGIAMSVVAANYRRTRKDLHAQVAERSKELDRANAALQKLNSDLENLVTAKTAELRLTNETLEQRVAERTAEVLAANSALDDSRRAALTLMDEAIASFRKAELVSSDLRLERDFTSAVLDNTGALVMVLDQEGRITRFNRACEVATGYSAGEVLGYVFWEKLIPLEEVTRVVRTWTSLLAGRFPDHHVAHVMTKQGAERLISWSNTSISGKGGSVEYIIGTGIDITASARAEEELLRTAMELARSNKDLEQFAHVTSHDLKEPLRMVTGFMSLLSERYGNTLDKKASEYVRFATDAAARMQSMIDDLLAYSRAGQVDTMAPTDLGSILDSALRNLHAAITESGAMITRDRLPTMIVHSTGLVQVFQNLVGNAIKFRKTGATPEIHIGARLVTGNTPFTAGTPSFGGWNGTTQPPIPTTPDKLAGNSPAPKPVDGRSFWLFSVRDNGIGFDPEFNEKVFVIFQRLHTREEYPGSGVGLPICKKIIERHGGRIWVDSKAGSGSVFFFSLPVRNKELV